MKANKRFRAQKALTLTEQAASAVPLSSGGKATDQEQVTALAQQIAACQDVFYAEHRRKLLIVLQGMDTSGKDGVVRGVFFCI